MTDQSAISLDSMRHIHGAAVPCFVCGIENILYVERCRQCCAPMTLVQASKNSRTSKLVSVLGCPGAGKTVYLGMLLEFLFRGDSSLSIDHPGSMSSTLHEDTVTALRNGEFPSPTGDDPSEWNWVNFHVRQQRRRSSVNLIIPDISGQAICDEINGVAEHPSVRSTLAKSNAAMILIDASQVEEQSQWAMTAIDHLLCPIFGRKTKWQRQPIAIVFTKTDRLDDYPVTIDSFADEHVRDLTEYCKRRLRRYGLFAINVAGACAFRNVHGQRVEVPLRIEPHGIVEPLEWLV